MRAGLPLLVTATTSLDRGIQLWIFLEEQARKVQVVRDCCKAFAGGVLLPAFRIRPPGFHQQKKLKNFPWLLKCRMLGVQGVSTLHPVLETEASASQAWPEGQDRTGCKQRLPQSKGSFLLWGSSRTWFGGRDTSSCLNLSSYFPSSYYIDGRVAKVTDFLKTRLLDTLSDQIRKIQKVSECKWSAGARGQHACSAWLWHSPCCAAACGHFPQNPRHIPPWGQALCCLVFHPMP